MQQKFALPRDIGSLLRVTLADRRRNPTPIYKLDEVVSILRVIHTSRDWSDEKWPS